LDTREGFARDIAEYPNKYVKSEQVLRERARADAAELDKLWTAPRQISSELPLIAETDTELWRSVATGEVEERLNRAQHIAGSVVRQPTRSRCCRQFWLTSH
jgi:hypothetical protein